MADPVCDRPGFSMPNTSRAMPFPQSRPAPTPFPSNHLTFPYLTANGADQISPLIRLAAEKYRYASLANFSTALTISSPSQNTSSTKSSLYFHPPTWCRSVRDASSAFLGWEVYYFDIAGSPHEPIPLEVRLLTPQPSKHGNDPHLPGIRIRYANVWLKISTFLDHYPPARNLRKWNLQQKPEALWESQWKWWVALSRLPEYNPLHKTFRILKLPGEIREIIYAHILPSPYNPYPRLRSRKLVGLARSRWLAAQPDRQLILLNKQIHDEASKVLFSDTMWFIPKFNMLDRVLLSPYFSTRVQRLHLALSHQSFIRLFTADNIVAVASLRPLREMKLREFILDFASPPAPYTVWASDGSEKRMVVCQKMIVDWILEAAEYWVVGHEGVRLAGCFKEEQRRKFEDKCIEGLRQLKAWREMDSVEGKELQDWDAWREDGGGVRLTEVVGDMGDKDGSGEVYGDEGGFDVQHTRTLDEFVGSKEPPECLCEESCALQE